jgi:hypothetical protein
MSGSRRTGCPRSRCKRHQTGIAKPNPRWAYPLADEWSNTCPRLGFVPYSFTVGPGSFLPTRIGSLKSCPWKWCSISIVCGHHVHCWISRCFETIPWIHIPHRILEHHPLQTSGGGKKLFRGTALAFNAIRRHARFPGRGPRSAAPFPSVALQASLFFPLPQRCSHHARIGCSGHGRRWWVHYPFIRLTLFWLPRRTTIFISVFLPLQREETRTLPSQHSFNHGQRVSERS